MGGSSELITVFNCVGATASIQPSSGTFILSLRNIMTEVFVVCLLTRHLQLHQQTISTSESCLLCIGQPTSQLACSSVELVKPLSCQEGGARSDSAWFYQLKFRDIKFSSYFQSANITVVFPNNLYFSTSCFTIRGNCRDLSHSACATPEEDYPINSSSKLTHSPCPKHFKCARTFSEAHRLRGSAVPTGHNPPFQRTKPQVIQQVIRLEWFKVNSSEAECLEETRKLIFNYIYKKELIKKVKVLIDLKPYYGKYKGTDTIPCEQSNVVYLSIVDKCADTNEPMHGGGIV